MEIGSILESFKILDRLGQGGMGEVYLAEDTRLGRQVAIKVVPERLRADEKARDRLLREARLASSLNHPHICTIHDIGGGDEGLYIVMEFVEGRTLKEIAAEEPLPPQKAISCGAQIASALAYAHGKGIIHRDLKAANVMVGTEERIKILDFGLALQISPDEISEASTMRLDTEMGEKMAGTLQYMAPEILEGSPADRGSDIWSLGVVLYEASTGKLPFRGRNVFDLTAAILKEPPAPIPPGVPPALATVIGRCLRKEPAQRYRHTGEVQAALEVLLSSAVSDETQALIQGASHFWDLSASVSRSLIAAERPGAVVTAPARKPRARPSRIESLAVLPLENLSGDPGQEFFSDCMTEALITDLAKIGALKVISRTSAMRFKGSDKPLPEIAGELGVEAVVEGSVLRVGDQVRISAQLVDASTDTHIWADSYKRDLQDILTLQSEVARAIANEIKIQLTPQERRNLSRRGMVHREAHEAMLRGRHCMRKPELVAEAIEWFEKAIELDPGYATPYTSLAEAYLLLGMYGFRRPRDVFPVAKMNATRALELDDEAAEAHCILAWAIQVYEFDRPACEKEYRRALELNPGAEETHRLFGCYLVGTGHTEEGLEMLRRSVELDPLSPLRNSIYAYGLYTARRFEEALERCGRVIENNPHFWWARWVRGETLVAQRRYPEAIAAYEHALTASQNAFTLGSLGAAYALSGEEDKARELLENMQAQARIRYVSPFFISVILVGLGDRDAAFEWLERAWEERDSWVQWLYVNPVLDGLRSDPRFHRLLTTMGFGGHNT